MNTGFRARVVLDTLPYGATRQQTIDAVKTALDDAYEAGRIEGRLEILKQQVGTRPAEDPS